MLSGIYSAEFASNKNVIGRGVAVFTGGTLQGGDASYYYKENIGGTGMTISQPQYKLPITQEFQVRSLAHSSPFGSCSMALQLIKDSLCQGRLTDSLL